MKLMTVRDFLENRSTTGRFDSTKKVDKNTVSELVRLATYSPSAFNLQN